VRLHFLHFPSRFYIFHLFDKKNPEFRKPFQFFLPAGQPRLGQMSLDPPATAIGDLVFGEGGEPSLSDCSTMPSFSPRNAATWLPRPPVS
jgi:hypothetical protein